MTTAIAERSTHRPSDVDRDGLDVYCPEAQAWARTRDLFCENCGDPGHDPR